MNKPVEIANAIEKAALKDGSWAIAYAILRCAKALENLGDLDAHGLTIKQAGAAITHSLNALAKALDEGP